MTIVLLIRHGMTEYVAAHRCAGRTPGVSLSSTGQEQAAAVAERLRTLPIKAIYSSPLERTMETAQAVAAALSLPVQARAGLLETDTGDWTGLPFKDIEERDATVWHALQTHPTGTRIPGGETMDEIRTRMAAQVDDICAAHPNDMVAVVSHADPIKAVITHYLGLDLDNFQRLVISPTSVSALQLGGQRATLLTMNHLGDLAQLAAKP